MADLSRAALVSAQGIEKVTGAVRKWLGFDPEEEEREEALEFIRNLTEQIKAQAELPDPASGFADTAISMAEEGLGEPFEVPTEYEALTGEELQIIEDLTAVPEGREDYEGAVLKQTQDDEQIRKNRQILDLLNVHEEYYEAGAPESASGVLKNLARIMTRQGRMTPEEKLRTEAGRQELRYGPGSARAGFEETKAGRREEEATTSFERSLSRDQLKQYYALQRMERRQTQHQQTATEKMAMAKAKMSAAEKTKFDVQSGTQTPESAIGNLDMDIADIEQEIANIEAVLDEGEVFGALEKNYERTLSELKRSRLKVKDAKKWVATEVGKIKPEEETGIEKKIKALTPAQRSSAIENARKWLASPENANHPNRAEYEGYLRALENYGR